MVLNPMPHSANPGIGSVRATEPGATTSTSKPSARDVPVGQLDRDLAVGVADRRDPARVHVALAQHPSQRHDHVAGLDRSRRRLGEERLVGHVRLRVDHRDLGLAAAQLLLQPQRRVHADVPAADDDDPGCAGHASMLPPRDTAYRTNSGDVCDDSAQARRRSGAAQHLFQHRGRQPSGERVLLRDVVAAEERPAGRAPRPASPGRRARSADAGAAPPSPHRRAPAAAPASRTRPARRPPAARAGPAPAASQRPHVSRSPGVGLLSGGAQCTGAVIRVPRSARPSPMWVDVGRLARPTACSAA